MMRKNESRKIFIAAIVGIAVSCNFAYFYFRQRPQQSITQIDDVLPNEITKSTIEEKTFDTEETACSATRPTLTSSGKLPGDGKPVRIARGSPLTLGDRIRYLGLQAEMSAEEKKRADLSSRNVVCSVPCLFFEKQVSDDALRLLDGVTFDTRSCNGCGEALKDFENAGLNVSFFAFSMESQIYYPAIRKAHEDPALETYTYRMDSTIPAPYFSWAEYTIQEYAPPLEGRIPALAVVASNCGPKNERNQLVQDLSEYIPVHSIGKCKRNEPWPTCNGQPCNKIEALRKYMMYGGFENSNTQDYVTEKIYHGLISGNIAVYLGAPNVHDFVPNNSVIARSDFGSVQEMGLYLKQLLEGPAEERQKWVSWKDEPLPQWFKSRFDFTHIHSECRMCRFLYARRNKLPWNHDLQNFCLP